MSEALTILLLPLAAYYVSWVIVHSKIASKYVGRWQVFWENRWINRHPDEPESDEWQSKLAYLPTCIWCTGFWVSGWMMFITMFFTPVPLWGLFWLANAAVIGIIDSLTHREA